MSDIGQLQLTDAQVGALTSALAKSLQLAPETSITFEVSDLGLTVKLTRPEEPSFSTTLPWTTLAGLIASNVTSEVGELMVHLNRMRSS